MNRQRGFTILELMAVVVIAGILLTIGLPSFQALMFNNRITSQLNLFSSSLALARSEAVKANQRVVICPSSDGASCATGVDFDTGWIVFIDRGGTDFDVDDDGGGNPLDDPCGPNAGDDAADDCILSYVDALTNADMTLRADLTNDYISFNGLGASNEAGSFVICDSRGDESARAIFVSTTGRASVRTTKLDGSALTCTP
ncbi:MAG: GspH/FimT family pseudopilin [Gammaproteobacteria bacterium]